MPRFLLELLMRLAIRASASDKSGNVSLDVLVRSVHFDIRLAAEMAGTVENFRLARTETLLLGGDRSAAYLPFALDSLARVLPKARRIELSGLGHLAADDVGQPERVADVLQPFFSQP